MRVRSKEVLRDYCGAAVVLLFGVGLAADSLTYPLGRMIRPGPGFFPLMIGCLIAVLGLVIAAETRLKDLRSHSGPEDEGAVETAVGFMWRPALAVTVGMLVFALLIDRAGYVAASVGLVFVSALGEIRRSWWAITIVAATMAIGGSLLFVWGLGLPVGIFGSR